MNFRSLAAFLGLLSASYAIICFFSARRFRCFCESLIRFICFCFATSNLFLESSSSFLFSGAVKPETFNEVNDTILDSDWFISLLARSRDGVSYCFESFSCGVKADGSFEFVLAVKTCCCSGSFEEVGVLSCGLVVSGVDADVIAAKELYKIYNKIFCYESYKIWFCIRYENFLHTVEHMIS